LSNKILFSKTCLYRFIIKKNDVVLGNVGINERKEEGKELKELYIKAVQISEENRVRIYQEALDYARSLL